MTDTAARYTIETVWMPTDKKVLTLNPGDLVIGSDQSNGGHYVTVLRKIPGVPQ